MPTLMPSALPMRADNWFGIAAPGGTPQEIVERLNLEIIRIVKDQGVADCLVSLGYQPCGGSVEDIRRTIISDRARWKAVIEANNIRAE